MSKQFDKTAKRLRKAAIASSSDKKATLILHCDDVAKAFYVGYSGVLKGSDDKIDRKHDELIMQILIEDDDAYKFIERIFTPVQRYRRREQKK
jgi:hypothetical protein